jgi:hypothetical protein
VTPANLETIETALVNPSISEEAAVSAIEALSALREQPTLRDRFAMAALTGMLASDARGRSMDHQTFYSDDPATAATHAYGLADAMLRQRAKPIDSHFAEVEEP